MEFNGILPTTQIQAIRFNKYRGRKWDWYPIDYWPRRLASAVINGRFSKDLTLGMFVFLVGNGMDPRQARDTIIREVNGDPELVRKVKYIETKVSDPDMKWGTFFDLKNQRVTDAVYASFKPIGIKKVDYGKFTTKYVSNINRDPKGYKWVDTKRFKQSDLDDIDVDDMDVESDFTFDETRDTVDEGGIGEDDYGNAIPVVRRDTQKPKKFGKISEWLQKNFNEYKNIVGRNGPPIAKGNLYRPKNAKAITAVGHKGRLEVIGYQRPEWTNPYYYDGKPQYADSLPGMNDFDDIIEKEMKEPSKRDEVRIPYVRTHEQNRQRFSNSIYKKKARPVKKYTSSYLYDRNRKKKPIQEEDDFGGFFDDE
ncbi:MAG: hypothetical protein [Cressdnaviricota sp.]|nr:MAG: hypothetical protein [Cressdnaviricota sp.]